MIYPKESYVEYLNHIIATIHKGWCQGEEARRIDGESTSIHSKEAASFCLIGAISKHRYTDILDFNGIVELIKLITQKIAEIDPQYHPECERGTHIIVKWNDAECRSKSQVIMLLERLKSELEDD